MGGPDDHTAPLRVHLVFPRLPPALDGIGDYTAMLAAALVDRCSVTVLTGEAGAAPVDGVAVREAFSIRPRSSIRNLEAALGPTPPDWLVLQYNPFSYGRYGLNPWLPLTVEAIRRRYPEMRLGLMVHEPFVPIKSPRFAVMATWQRWQLWRLGRNADFVFCSIEAWADRFTRWFPHSHVAHLPVGSNIPMRGWSRSAARSQLGIAEDAFVVGLFGAGFTAGMQAYLARALGALASRAPHLLVLYIGTRGEDLRAVAGEISVLDLGPRPAEEVSRGFAAMDLYLAPYPDGISTRRGSAIVALQHGIPVLSTCGHLTDSVLRNARGEALALSPIPSVDAFAAQAVALYRYPERRVQLARGGRSLYEEHFDWEVIGASFLAELERHEGCNGAVPDVQPVFRDAL